MDFNEKDLRNQNFKREIQNSLSQKSYKGLIIAMPGFELEKTDNTLQVVLCSNSCFKPLTRYLFSYCG